MTSAAQVAANRSNAEKSTGPRTPEGKEKAAQNALTHGLFAREAVIRGEDEDEFEMYRESLLDQLMPRAPLEEILADRIVDLSWRLKRAAQDQEAAFGALYEKYLAQQAGAEPEAGSASGTGIPSASLSGQALPVNPNHGQARPEPCERDAHATAPTLGRMILEDFTHEAVLDRLLRYERRIESSLYRTLNELRRVHDQLQKAAQEEVTMLERWRDEDWEAKKARAFARCRPVEASPGPAAGTTNVPTAEVPHPGASPSWQDAGPAPEGPAEDETCKTNPIPEEVSSVKCQVSSEPSRVWGPGSLSTSSFTLQTSGPAPTARDETCKTNPIPEEVSSVKCQVLRGQPALQTTHFKLDTAAESPSETCKTNPISADAAVESPHYSNIPSFQHSSPQAWDAGQSCKTNPILEAVSSVKGQVLSQTSGASSPGSLPTSNFTLQTSGPAPAGQSETCKTNPISEEVSRKKKSLKCEIRV